MLFYSLHFILVEGARKLANVMVFPRIREGLWNSHQRLVVQTGVVLQKCREKKCRCLFVCQSELILTCWHDLAVSIADNTTFSIGCDVGLAGLRNGSCITACNAGMGINRCPFLHLGASRQMYVYILSCLLKIVFRNWFFLAYSWVTRPILFFFRCEHAWWTSWNQWH